MPAADKLAKSLVKALKPAQKGFHRSTKRGAALAELYHKLGPRTLYRYKGAKTQLKPVGSVDAEAGEAMDAFEPRGMYFADKMENLPHLLVPNQFEGVEPFYGESTVSSLRDALGDLIGRRAKSGDAERLIRARLLPKARELEIYDADAWRSKLDEFGDSVDKQHPLHQILTDVAKGTHNREDESLVAQAFTEWLRKNYDVVTFPDTAAGQDDLLQTVLLNRGKAVGRQGEFYRILGILGALMGSKKEENGDR